MIILFDEWIIGFPVICCVYCVLFGYFPGDGKDIQCWCIFNSIAHAIANSMRMNHQNVQHEPVFNGIVSRLTIIDPNIPMQISLSTVTLFG